MKRPVTGRTEMDIIHDVADGVINEARGMRTDIKGYIMSQALPLPKTPEEREARKVRYRQAIETDKEIEKIGRRLFFGETEEPPNKPKEEQPTPKPTLYFEPEQYPQSFEGG